MQDVGRRYCVSRRRQQGRGKIPPCEIRVRPEEVKFMEKIKLDRLSELTRIARTRDLTAEEQQERTALRNEYRQAVTGNLRAQLESMTIVEPDGSRIRVSDLKRSGEDK